MPDMTFWESDLGLAQSTANKIGVLAYPASVLPDQDPDEGCNDVLSALAEASSDTTVGEVPCVDGSGAGIEEDERTDQVAESLDIDVHGTVPRM